MWLEKGKKMTGHNPGSNSTFFFTRCLQICVEEKQVLCISGIHSLYNSDLMLPFPSVCLWVSILKVTLSHFIGAACIQLEYLLTVHPHPVAINQALRYDIQHKLVTGLAGAEESDASREQLLLVLSACEKRFLPLR